MRGNRRRARRDEMRVKDAAYDTLVALAAAFKDGWMEDFEGHEGKAVPAEVLAWATGPLRKAARRSAFGLPTDFGVHPNGGMVAEWSDRHVVAAFDPEDSEIWVSGWNCAFEAMPSDCVTTRSMRRMLNRVFAVQPESQTT